MSTWSTAAVVSIGLACVGACTGKPVDAQQPPATAESPTPAPERAEAPASSAPSSAAAAPAPSPPPASRAQSAPVLEKRFLPHRTECTVDADCAVTTRGLSERFFCCDPCGAVAGTKDWVARANGLCAAYDRGPSHHTCPPRDCAPPGPARCEDGACTL